MWLTLSECRFDLPASGLRVKSAPAFEVPELFRLMIMDGRSSHVLSELQRE